MNLEDTVQQWAKRDGWVDQYLSRALSGDTTEAAAIWRAIASGKIDSTEALIWAQHVAKQIVETVIDGGLAGSERPRAALAALGFRGQVDQYAKVRERISDYLHFEPELTNAELLGRLAGDGYLKGMPRKTALTRIAELRNKIS